MDSKPSLASPLDAVPLSAAVVGAILMRYLTGRKAGHFSVQQVAAGRQRRFAALLHHVAGARRGRRNARAARRRSTLTETLALLQHCSLADDSKSVGVGVISRLRVDARPAARGVELRCPRRSWRPWMPSASRFAAEVDAAREVRRVAPIPPVTRARRAGPPSPCRP